MSGATQPGFEPTAHRLKVVHLTNSATVTPCTKVVYDIRTIDNYLYVHIILHPYYGWNIIGPKSVDLSGLCISKYLLEYVKTYNGKVVLRKYSFSGGPEHRKVCSSIVIKSVL